MRHLRVAATVDTKPAVRRVSAAALALEASLANVTNKPTTKRKPNPRACLESAKGDVQRMIEERDWTEAGGRHFVALFAWLHEQVYGVAPEEIYDSKAYAPAVACASRMLSNDFGSDSGRMLAYVRWVWARERAVEGKRRTNGGGGRRITWQLLFATRSLIVDYRVALVREGVRAEA